MNITRKVQATWTWRHKEYVVIMSLLLALVIQTFELGLPQAEAVVYVAPDSACTGLQCEIERRTERLYKEREQHHKEMIRLEVLRTINRELLEKLHNSPYKYDYSTGTTTNPKR